MLPCWMVCCLYELIHHWFLFVYVLRSYLCNWQSLAFFFQSCAAWGSQPESSPTSPQLTTTPATWRSTSSLRWMGRRTVATPGTPSGWCLPPWLSLLDLWFMTRLMILTPAIKELSLLERGVHGATWPARQVRRMAGCGRHTSGDQRW